jgi:hypothetical protein
MLAETRSGGTTAGRRPRVFSGIQPSGDVHLGNYLGAINTSAPTPRRAGSSTA